MAALGADFSFDYTFPSQSIEPPSTPPDMSSYAFDPSLLGIPFHAGHARSSSRGSVYSVVSSAVESTPETVYTRVSTPPRDSPPFRQHGPLLLPKIRSQDQEIDLDAACSSHVSGYVPARSFKTSTPPPKPAAAAAAAAKMFHQGHSRSFTDPNLLNSMAFAHLAFAGQAEEQDPAPLLCSPATFVQDGTTMARRSSSCNLDSSSVDKWAFPSYRTNSYGSSMSQMDYSCAGSYGPRESSPLSIVDTPDPTPSTTLFTFLTSPNPAASLVRSINFPMRDPNVKHFWWDIRNIRSWSNFNMSTVLSLPGASALLTTPVPAPVLPKPGFSARHPETEAALHNIYATYYLAKLNSALAISSNRPLQLSVPAPTSRTSTLINDHIFVGNVAGESATAATMFGGKPSARVVGLVRSYERFNTGMRAESNIKRVEYLRGLAAIHHVMREHGCRYGFILTEIELVIVRNGTETTPFFGDLDVTSVQLVAAAPEHDISAAANASFNSNATTLADSTPLTACLALWGLCQIASDSMSAGQAPWKSEIGAPAEGTRRKAKPRDKWMPQPQLAEKREAKRSRGWVWPEDAIGRKELGKRGVRYGGL